MGRKSDYSTDMFKQMQEIMERLSKMEAVNTQNQKKLKEANADISSMSRTIAKQETEIEALNETVTTLRSENERLIHENHLLLDDNKRMKRILNNNSRNSSLPPSTDQKGSTAKADCSTDDKEDNEDDTGKPGKPANTYNGRKSTKNKKGGQTGHRGTTLSRKTVEEKIQEGKFNHQVKTIGQGSGDYIVRYVLDLSIGVTATEVRIYSDENGKFQIPPEYASEVTYGSNIRAVASMLYSEGVMSNDRICAFINSISGDTLSISEGCIYSICKQFSRLCAPEVEKISEDIRNSDVVCTDATTMSLDGKQAYVRNMSTERSVVYMAMLSKTIETMKEWPLLAEFSGILEHDHETGMYHFGTGHAECNVHLSRYLLKNTEETGNRWSHDLTMYLNSLNHYRKTRMEKGAVCFTEEQLKKYNDRYDKILQKGWEEHKQTKGRYTRKEEKKLLNRLEKYKGNHLLFLYNFKVPFSDNMSERDLRKCKNRQKMSGGFRKMDGMKMYCTIMGYIETVKRRGLNIYQSIAALFGGRSVIG